MKGIRLPALHLMGVVLVAGGIAAVLVGVGVLGLLIKVTVSSFTWSSYAQQITSGLATGSIYGSLALALVLVYRTTDIVNFSQGEMATFTTFVAWSLMGHGLSYWPAFVLTLLIAFSGGVAVERTLIRPVEGRPELVIVIVTIGLLIALNGLTGWIWGAEVKAVDSPFPNSTVDVGGVSVSSQDIGTFCVCLGAVLVLWLFFRFTTLGLAMRAVALNPDASRLMGVRVGWLLGLGWGFAAVLGAIAGLMAAPTLYLVPDMMLVVLIYAFAAAVLGGIDSPVGAVVGGLVLGVIVNLLGTYVHFVAGELALPSALAILLLVLLVRPQGLFGHVRVRRV
jgi:branched-chain amino acid transport system permease protein